ncbi:MAG: polyphosphate kinase 1 [Anaerolineae bacterium]|nr:polyphosphate kinase 1 [Anaerolineae bacterium]
MTDNEPAPPPDSRVAETDLPPQIDLDDPSLYFNRELSGLQFNRRVLGEALSDRNPTLERVKFLAIFDSNLDEFFMIRISGLRQMLAAGITGTLSDGMTPLEQVAAIRREVEPDLEAQHQCWERTLRPRLAKAGIAVMQYEQLQPWQRELLRGHFEQVLYPTLTPLAFDPGHPFPHISNLSLNLAVVLDDPEHGERFARVKIPDIFPRLLRIPVEPPVMGEPSVLSVDTPGPAQFVWIEDVIAANLDRLFVGMQIVGSHLFRVTRDADVEIEEDEAADLLTTIEERVGLRHFGSVIRLEVESSMPDRVRDILTTNLGLQPYLVYAVNSPMGMVSLWELMKLDAPNLKDRPFVAAAPPVLSTEPDIFSAIRRQNIILYHPYDSFSPVVEFVHQAACDPQVLAIKQTLYRVDRQSPIVAALMEARDNGKQVAVLVELKARFDEENNIGWARELERVGVHVVYGLVGLKVHCKLCLVVRREEDGIRRYVHVSTGNYNRITARIYSDIGYFTCDPDLGADLSDLFNVLTGYSRQNSYRKLLVAPTQMRKEILRRIEREIERQRAHGDGYIAFKMNALVDEKCIKALYRASQAGVKVDLQVRGICSLRPGLPGVSENITVTSVVGRFLEHARMYYFRNGGEEELYLGSADLMPRNLDRRVEQLFPVEDPAIRESLMKNIMQIHLGDNVQSHMLLPDGHYERLRPGRGGRSVDSQAWMIDQRGIWHYYDTHGAGGIS